MKKQIIDFFKLIKTSVIIAALLLSGAANATLLSFANGDFEGYLGNTNTHNSDVPPGWTTTGGTPDTFDGNTNFGSYTWASSSTGGDFLHGIGDQPDWSESAVQDGLSGLVIGQQYEISFEQSISRSTWSQTGGFWRIMFGSEVQDSAMMDIPDFGVFEGWTWQTMIFTATAETQNLQVKAMSDTDHFRTDIGIDSFYLGNPGENPDNPDTPSTSVPEPSSILLLGLAIVGMASRRKHR